MKTAFLNGDLSEEIYLMPPQPHPEDKVWRLRKGIYGLKQAGRVWYKRLDTALLSLGFTRSQADPCLYIHGNTLLAVYVDDIIIAADDIDINPLKQKLMNLFNMTDLGPVKWVLGVNIISSPDRTSFLLSQRAYIESILSMYNMLNCRGVTAPLETRLGPATPEEQDEFTQLNISFAQAVGKLAYLAQVTRPDLAYTLSALARYQSSPGIQHWRAFKHVLRYLSSTRNLSLIIKPSDLSLTSFADSDWAGDDTRRSTSGNICQLGGATITWSSVLQRTVALSTAEAEYVSVANAAKQVLWIQQLLSDIGINQTKTPLYCDNQAALALTKNPIKHQKTKHMDIQYHFVRELQASGTISVAYCPTTSMPADIMTKPLSPKKNQQCLELLQIGDMSTHGRVL